MSLERLAARLESDLEGRVEEDRPLRGLTTYRLGGPAALYVEPTGVADLEAFARALRAEEVAAGNLPVLPMGRGSNLVVSDHGFEGVVVHLGPGFSWIRTPDGSDAAPEAGGATPLPQLANWAARRGVSGVEFAVAIPGSLGGGVRMNAGAHGRELCDVLEWTEVFDARRASLERREVHDLAFAYRRSNLSDHEIVTRARFGLEVSADDLVKQRTESYRRRRAETQPAAVQNAGSVFKNPPGDHAGRLVDAAGLKGFRVRGAHVSTLHGNFFIADEGASAQDVYDLVYEVRERVAQRFGIGLEPEIRFVGPFNPGSSEIEVAG